MNAARIGSLIFAAVLAVVMAGQCLLAGEANGEGQKLVICDGTNLDGWRQPTGQWLVAESVHTKADNPRVFAIEQGQGVLVNGETGKTSNLLSKHEHGDVKLHVEFCLPRGSNSGVYLMGRYEIQVYDSWGVEQPKYIDCGGIYQRWKDGQGLRGACSAPQRQQATRPMADIRHHVPRAAIR